MQTSRKNSQTKLHPQQTTDYINHGTYLQTQPSVERKFTIPLIDSIAQENKYFKNQQLIIASELQTLSKVSESLLLENQQLRKHYQNRTLDIRNIIKTFEINVNEDIGDYQHRAFLMKEANCGLLKKIKECMKQHTSITNNIQQKEQLLKEVGQERQELEQNMLNNIKVRLVGHLNQEAIQNIMRDQEQLTADVNQLLQITEKISMDNQQLQYKNKRQQELIDQTRFTLKAQGENWNHHLQHIRAEVNNYKEEIRKEQAVYQRELAKNQHKKEFYQQSVRRLKESTQKKQILGFKLTELQSQKQQLKRSIYQSHQSKVNAEGQDSTLLNEKQNLSDRINEKLNNIKNLKNLQKRRKNQLQEDQEGRVKIMKENLRKNELISMDEINKLKAEGAGLVENISEYDREHALVSADIEEYQKVVKGLNNPIVEIERAEMILRLHRSKIR